MTRLLRTQLADLAEAWLRAARPDLTRERAADLLTDWPLAEPWDEDTTAEVLSRFPSAEPPSVPGVDFLPGAVVTSDMAPLIDRARAANPGGLLTAAALNAAAEAVAVLDEPKAERHCDDCGHAESRHSRLNCNGSSETERCWCYAFRLPEVAP